MANGQHDNTFTALDIEKYHKGLLSPAEMHRLERAALEDPFLADALEGYATEGVNVSADMAELQRRLNEKTGKSKVVPIGRTGGSRFPVLRVAAMVAILIVAGYLITRFAWNDKDNEIAKLEKTTTPTNRGTGIDTVQQNAGSVATRQDNTAATTNTNLPSTIKTESSSNNRDAASKGEQAISKRDEEQINHAPVQDKPDTSQVNAVVTNNPAEAHVMQEMDKAITSKDNDDKKAKAATAKRLESQARSQPMNTFRGRVTDDANNGVPFANVTAINENVGTYADANGYFNFRAPDTVLDVQVRSIGFENNVSRLRRSAPTNRVVLAEDRSLDEMVISNTRPNTEARARRNNVTVEEPEPADGWTNYDAYLANNLNIPEDYKTKPEPNPSVEVSFEVNSLGEPVNIRVERSLCTKCDNEAIRLIKEGPKWKANARGRTRVTINF